MKLGYLLVSLIPAVMFAALPSTADACTRTLANDDPKLVVASRTMDWPESTLPRLWVFPRGLTHHGGLLDGHPVVSENPLDWTSKYASAVTTIYGLGTADGLNEKGLGAHMLFLTATDYGPRDPKLFGVQAALLPQYVLDQAATVVEALSLLEHVQPVMVEAHGRKSTVHYALEDASGDSAIIEYIGGKRVVHHGHEFRIMTNDPTYDEQLALLKSIDMSHPSSNMPLGGNVNPRDRFQRAAYYVQLLPAPSSEPQAVAGVMAIARNVSVPFGAPYQDFGVYNTEYRTVVDLSNRRYFFELSTNPSLVWIDLSKVGTARGAPARTLDPTDWRLSGDVTAKLKQAKAPF